MNFTPNAIYDIMLIQFKELRRLDAPAAPSMDALFPFQPEDVYVVHFYKQGEGDGVWFRLLDDRVFDASGQPSESDLALYVTEAHTRRRALRMYPLKL